MTESDQKPLALVVDDERMIRIMSREVLEKAGFSVLEAEDGRHALAHLEKRLPDIVLLDVVMPELDGFAVCEALRRMPGGDQVSVMMMTALDDEGSINRAYDLGATDFVAKPINWVALGHHVRYLLRASRAFRDLKTSETRLAQAQRIARLGHWEWELSTARVVCSEEVTGLFGRQSSEGGPAFEGLLAAIPEEDADLVRTGVEEALAGRGGFSLDHRVLSPGGELLTVHHQAEVFTDGEGQPIRLAGTVQDITERKHLEQDLQDERNFVSAILETAGALVLVLNREGGIVRFNRACEKATGYSFAEVEGRRIWDLVLPPEEAEAVLGVWRQLLEGGQPNEYQNHWLDREGRRRLIAWSNTVLASPDGSVQYIIATGIDITERKRAEDQLVHLGYFDSLTDLPNRHLFKDRLGQALRHVRRHQGLVGTLFLDLDRFKRINETLGHSEGDYLLKAVGDRLHEFLRESDTVARAGEEGDSTTVARLGGDEFCVLLTDLARVQDAAKGARRLLEAFSLPFVLSGGQEVYLTASIGISIFPHDGEEVETLLKNAEVAMYHAKSQGRDNYQFYTQSMNAMGFERLVLESDMRRAFDRDEFVLYYQPLVDLESGRIVALEALARWKHPEQGLVSPAHFIPLALETGMIDRLVEWTLRTSCRQNAAWQKAGLPPVRMAVNMPSRQFLQQDVRAFVKGVLDETGLDPRWLELEITEESVMKNEERSIAILGGLREMGIHIAIDDFGTGYSSLSYLKSFPVDTLKIDMSFIREIPEDQNNASIVRAIIAMGHSLRLTVLAEGVETSEQLEFLREAGCDEIQGFLYCRPIPVEGMAKLLSGSIIIPGAGAGLPPLQG